MATNNDEITLNVTSYNMHGIHQGYALLEDLCSVNCPDVLLLQEHWLTPDNLYKFDRYFSHFSLLVARPCEKQLKVVFCMVVHLVV